jgi:hypothetical protein
VTLLELKYRAKTEKTSVSEYIATVASNTSTSTKQMNELTNNIHDKK